MPISIDAGRLEGKRVVVTGASRGIGAAVAQRFASLGADIILAARKAETLEPIAEEVRKLGSRALVVAADMTDRYSLQTLIDSAVGEFGGVDVLINNAGVLPPATRATSIDWDLWDSVLAVNLNAPWYLACRAKETMTNGGVVINVASTAAFFPSRGLVPYNVAKAGLVMMTRVLALEWARDKVRVLAIAPGKVDTDMVKPILDWSERKNLELNPMARAGSTDEIADLAAFLASDRAGYMTGVTIPIDGGELLTVGSETGR